MTGVLSANQLLLSLADQAPAKVELEPQLLRNTQVMCKRDARIEVKSQEVSIANPNNYLQAAATLVGECFLSCFFCRQLLPRLCGRAQNSELPRIAKACHTSLGS